MAWFDPGKTVICIKRGGWYGAYSRRPVQIRRPEYGERCTVEAKMVQSDGLVVLRLHGYEGWMVSYRFRPPVARSTDTGMSILHDLLNEQPVRKPEREEA